MEERVQSAGTMSPVRLLVGFTKGRIVVWAAVAVVIHVVLIGMLSMGYIRDRWDPKGAEARKAAALAAQETLKKEAVAKAARPTTSSSPTGAVAQAHASTGTTAAASAAPTGITASTGTAVTASNDSSSTGSTEQVLDERKNAPVVKRITEKAQPSEIPTQPDDLGISIGDTSIH